MATSNPVCQRCGLEMEVAGIGWLVVYMGYDPPAPYEARWGDLCSCRQCAAAVVTKFADGRPMGHFQGEPFESALATGLKSGKLAVVWERYADRTKVSGPLDKYLWDWLERVANARQLWTRPNASSSKPRRTSPG